MSKPTTLIDTLYRVAHSKERVLGWTNNAVWKDMLRKAKRFVLDDKMSTFLGELGTQAFVREKLSAANKHRAADHLRIGARLPSAVTWIEYNLRKCQARSNELLGREINLEEMPEREGWLLMKHPTIETAFQAIIVSHDPSIDHGDGFDTWTFPIALGWTADSDTLPPWKPIQFDSASNAPSEISTGLLGYRTDKCGFFFHDMITTPNQPKQLSQLLREWSGVQRRMWAFLATLNDLPVEIGEVRASRGFMGGGQYRKFLDHKTLTINLPAKQHTKIIRNALAIAHRRGGPVREHWRQDWRRPLSVLCDHEWGADEKHRFCLHCKGRHIWVNEHVRGDTSKGFVLHDFVVTHEVED